MSEEKRFTRLLGACEKLIREEAFAIKGNNFDYLTKVLSRKGKLIDAIAQLGVKLGLNDGRRPELREMLSHMIDAQQRNLELSRECGATLRSELTRISQGRIRARELRQSYGSANEIPTSSRIQFTA